MQTRRSFAARSALGVAGSFLYLGGRVRGANDRVTLALIGGRNQGKGDALRSIQQGAEIATFCDLDEAILGEVSPLLSKAQGKDPKHERDYRRVLDDKSIDAVIIAT